MTTLTVSAEVAENIADRIGQIDVEIERLEDCRAALLGEIHVPAPYRRDQGWKYSTIGKPLSPRQAKVFAIVQENPGIVSTQVVALSGLKLETYAVLRRLAEIGRVRGDHKGWRA